MKNILFVLLLTTMYFVHSFSTTHVIRNSGTTFVPNTLTINFGDTVNFVLESIHNAREVSKATWDANQNTSNGGFETPFGGGIVVLQSTGTHYYVCVPHASLGMKGMITVNPTTNVYESRTTIPAKFILRQNYPNPFNPSTIITFKLITDSWVTLKVFNILGVQIATLIDEKLPGGEHSLEWNGINQPSGIYFYQLRASGFTVTKRMILAR